MNPTEQQTNILPIEITSTNPADGARWPIGSTQSILWSLKGLPQGNFNTVIFLSGSGTKDVVAGSILEQISKEGSNSAEYKVGLLNSGGDALVSLKPGTYQIIFRIYRVSQGNSELGYGELVSEKKEQNVVVK